MAKRTADVVEECSAAMMLSVSGIGVGAASIRMNTANFTMSLGTFRGRLSSKFVGLSGVPLKWQPDASSRSCGNRLLVTPCSTYRLLPKTSRAICSGLSIRIG